MTEPGPRAGSVRPIAFVPALLLVAAVVTDLTTSIDDAYAFDAIFGAVVAGVVVAIGSVLHVAVAERPATALRSGVALGGGLAATAVLLYLLVGCAFGCPA